MSSQVNIQSPKTMIALYPQNPCDNAQSQPRLQFYIYSLKLQIIYSIGLMFSVVHYCWCPAYSHLFKKNYVLLMPFHDIDIYQCQQANQTLLWKVHVLKKRGHWQRQKQKQKTAWGPVRMLQCALTKAEWETLTHSIKRGYLYQRSLQSGGNTPSCKLAAAPCEISNQPMCGWSPQQGYHLRQSKWLWQHLPPL